MTASGPLAPTAAGGRPPAAARITRHAGWPLTALLMLYPLWWALGLGTLIVFILAVVMAVLLVRRGRIETPPGFGLWLLFLVCVVASVAMLGYNPPGTLPQSASHRVVSVVYNFVGLLSGTVILLYAGNLTEEEFPRHRLVRQLGVLFCTTVAGGLLGVVAPRFQFTSPVELLLPARVAQDVFVRSLVHPAASQLQSVFGSDSLTPRPAAPFGFTNTWGYVFALLVGWFVISWIRGASRGRRVTGLVILALAAVPVVYSLNRGLWVGLGLAVVFIAFRLVARGNLAALTGILAVLIAAAALFTVSPLGTVIQQRLEHGQSNDIRTFTTVQTLDAVSYSPVLGLGATRAALGSSNSIAVGQSQGCPRCGNATLGSNGSLWAVLISNGYLGVLLNVGFFLRVLWTYRHDRSPIGDAGLLAVFLSLWFMFVYNILAMPLVIIFLSISLLWRNRREQAAAELRCEPASPAARAGLAR